MHLHHSIIRPVPLIEPDVCQQYCYICLEITQEYAIKFGGANYILQLKY